MTALVVLLLLYLAAVLVLFPIVTLIRQRRHDDSLDALQRRIGFLEDEIKNLRTALRNLPPASAPQEVVAPIPPVAARTEPLVPPTAPAVSPTPPAVAAASANAEPPALGEISAATKVVPPAISQPTPRSLPPAPPPPVYVPPPPAPSWTDNINWEQFMGAKLFAWLGGLALFLGVAFFVKFSFEHGWIPPALRVAIGFVIGAGLVVGGLLLDRTRYRITSQTLVAAGIVSLYAVTFACRSIYHFEFFGVVPTFLLMTLITAAAFVIAIRLEAQVVAVLGILGGFLTPVLLSTGVDNPGGLFGYLALLDAGLIAVALHRRWFYLAPLGAAGTILMMIGWANEFFTAEKGPIAMTVSLGFSALFLAATLTARRLDRRSPALTWSSVALSFAALGFALYFLDYHPLAARAGLWFGFLLLADLALLALAWFEDELPKLHLAAGVVVFLLLAGWTTEHLTDALLPWALAAYLLFAALHAAFPLVLERRRPAAVPTWWSQLFPPLALVLMLLPIFKLPAVPFLLWPAVLLVDLLAIALAALSASLVSVAVVLVLTLLATAVCLFRVPATFVFEPSLLLVIGFFAVFFFAASFWLVRKLGAKLPTDANGPLVRVFGDARAQLPAFASLLPFLLLIMACARLQVPDPSAVFGLALLLVVLTLGLAVIATRPFDKLRAFGSGTDRPAMSEGQQAGAEWLPACALAGVAGLEYAWHTGHFNAAAPALPLFWYFGFYAVFAAYPFAFQKHFARLTGPWAVAALSGVAHFPLVYRIVQLASPNDVMGLLPAGFAVPPLLSLVAILRTVSADNPKRLNQLAWFGGVALLFITLIFPIQFERQWLTVAWALEGAALLWLFHRVPHPGLRATGAVLLVTAFARLALNPAVLAYHARSATPVFNWYLYAYGLVTASLFVSAYLTAPPRERVLGVTVPPLFNALGTILAFLLLNIEIADYFTPPGSSALTFQFSGNFARDMSYTIGWALFALGLLAAGIWKETRATRYAALVLLSVTLFKLFFHDLARLEALYRIGALFAVAVIAILASFAYQRFLPANEKSSPPES